MKRGSPTGKHRASGLNLAPFWSVRYFSELLGSLHTHLFAIGTVLLALSLLLSCSDLQRVWSVRLIAVGFAGLWLDTGGWVLGRSSESAVWLIIAGGAMTSGALAAMAVVVVLDCWIRIPLFSRYE